MSRYAAATPVTPPRRRRDAAATPPRQPRAAAATPRRRRRSAECVNDAGEFVLAARDGGYAVFVDSGTLGAPGTGGNFGLVRLGPDEGPEYRPAASPSPSSGSTRSRLPVATVNA